MVAEQHLSGTPAANVASYEREYVGAIISHVLWGLDRARLDPDVPEIANGTVTELSRLTGIQVERLRRRLVLPDATLPGSYAHNTNGPGRLGPIPMSAWEYLYICECLGISTNPYVRTEYDGSYGLVTSLE